MKPKTQQTRNNDLLKPKSRPKNDSRFRFVHRRSAPPFVTNERGMLVHRPAEVFRVVLGGELSHNHVTYLCGGGTNFTNRVSFGHTVRPNDIVCAKCEAVAAKMAKRSASQIMGTHVCVGGIKPYRMCCPHLDD